MLTEIFTVLSAVEHVISTLDGGSGHVCNSDLLPFLSLLVVLLSAPLSPKQSTFILLKELNQNINSVQFGFSF